MRDARSDAGPTERAMEVLDTPIKNLSLAVLLALASSAATADEAPSYVLKLGAGGDVVAAVPTDGTSPTLVLAPLEPRADLGTTQVATGLAGVLELPVSPESRLSIGGGQQWVLTAPNAGSAAWCANLEGWLALSSPNECLAANAGSERQPVLARQQAEVGYGRENFDLALSYGIGDGVAGLAGSPVESSVTPWSPLLLSLPTASFGGRESEDVALSGTWRFSPIGALRVSAGLGNTSIDATLGLPSIDVDRAMLGVGITRGPFSGGVVGRVMRNDLPGASAAPWGGLDVGVAWRTPWAGELSFGARNLISGGAEPALNDTQAELELGTARTPYVQYKQDL